MNTDSEDTKSADRPPGAVVQTLDRGVVALVKVLIVLATLKSRDPRERSSNLLKPDHRQQTRIRNWQAVLEWSPRKRVGCFVGVLIGIGIGGAILWYGLK